MSQARGKLPIERTIHRVHAEWGSWPTASCTILATGTWKRFPHVAFLALGASVCMVASCDSRAQVSALAGVYHLEGVTDATNLVIRRDGTFEWNSDLCGSSIGDSGRLGVGLGLPWLGPEIGSLVYFPTEVREGDGGVSYQPAHRVWQTLLEDGTLRIYAVGVDADGLMLLWHPGGVCSICDPETGLHSTGIEPCDPFGAD